MNNKNTGRRKTAANIPNPNLKRKDDLLRRKNGRRLRLADAFPFFRFEGSFRFALRVTILNI